MTTAFRLGLVAFALAAAGACSSDTGSTEPGTPVTIDWAPCINDVDAPSWFAVQDGAKAWARVTPASGAFSFAVRSDKIGVATFANGLLSITFATPTEIQSLASTCGSVRRSVSGTVTGYTSPDEVAIHAEASSASVSGGQTAPAAFVLSDVAPSAFDVLATRSRSTVTGSIFQVTPTSVFIRRAQNTSSLALIDMNSATEAGAPLTQTATVANAATGENLLVVASLNTPTTAIDMGMYQATLGTVSGSVTAPFYGLAAARLVAAESQTLDVIATKTVSSSTSYSRTATLNYTASADKTVTLGPVLNPVIVSTGSRPSVSYTIQAGYDQTFELDLDQSSSSIQLVVTKGYLGSATTQLSVRVPDLSGVSGFLSSWLLTPGQTATWTFFAAGADIGVFKQNNQSYTAASFTQTFTP
jgi:hypothetical protein